MAVSSTSDGDMRFSGGDVKETTQNRQIFLKHVGITPEQTTRVQITYDNAEHFARYSIVGSKDKSLGMVGDTSNLIADGLVVKKPGHALFLLVADCVAVVLYDSTRQCLMLSHIGRHSVESNGAVKSVQFLIDECGSNAADIKVWLSPAASQTSYPIYSMNNRGLHEVIIDQLIHQGILKENIEISAVDTTVSTDYFSHSRFLSGQTDQIDGRFAVVAMVC